MNPIDRKGTFALGFSTNPNIWRGYDILWMCGSLMQLVRSGPDQIVRFEPWPGALCCVVDKTLNSQCLSPPRCINAYRRI